jgi:hypothetical protein
MELLFLLALLPEGISPRELDQLWKAFKDLAGFHNKMRVKESIMSMADVDNMLAVDCKWKRAYLKLRKYRLI